MSRGAGQRGNEGKKPSRRPHSFPLLRSASDFPRENQPYYHTFPNSSTSQLPDARPPDYEDEINQFKIPPSRFKISPREEEGRELLPGYTCSLKADSVFSMKTELVTPFDRCEDRLWSKVFVRLEGTMLNIHRLRTPHIFSKSAQNLEGTPDMPAGASAGSLLRSYTLQHAEVGMAADYRKVTQIPFAGLLRLVRLGEVADTRMLKRDFVIRVRAESEQFLLSCETIDTFLFWLESLGAAIDLAPPLDERSLPRYQTIPRRRRRRPRELLQEQQRIIRERFPNLLEENETVRTAALAPTATRPDSDSDIITPVETSNSIYEDSTLPNRHRPSLTVRRNSTSADSTSSDVDLTEIQETPQPTPEAPVLSSSASTSSSENDEDSKWRPCHVRNPEAEIRRRKRCQRVLTANEPRLSDVLVKDGKRWRIDYAHLKLVAWQVELPAYEGKADQITTAWRRRGLPEQGF
jgi:hypothetical protein